MDEERYREEQIGELEALNSIYVEEIESKPRQRKINKTI